MHVIGVVEVAAGLMVAVAPRFGAPLVAAWLGGIVFNLLTYSGYYDIALRDFGLMVGALALWRLAVGSRPRVRSMPRVSKRITLGAIGSACASGPTPRRRIVVLVHGYGEHIGRYEHVAEALVERGAIVSGPTHRPRASPRASAC